MSENTDTEIVHTIFVADILQIIALHCQDIRDLVLTADDDELRERVEKANEEFANQVDRIRFDARDNYKEALAARQKLREQKGGQHDEHSNDPG